MVSANTGSGIPASEENSPTIGTLVAVAPLTLAAQDLTSGAMLGAALAVTGLLAAAGGGILARILPAGARLPAALVLLALVAAALDLAALALPLGDRRVVGLALPLLATQVRLAVPTWPVPAAGSADGGLSTALAGCALLPLLGAVREFVGTGRIVIDLVAPPIDWGVGLAAAPAGALLATGALLAALAAWRRRA